jgi:YggT family protein
VRDFIATILLVFLIILAIRAILSWFPVRQGTFLASVNSLVFELTEWLLRPVRRLIPPIGMFDVSFMVVFFMVVIARSVVLAG